MVQVPAVTMVTVLPVTVHTPLEVELYPTANPEEATAVGLMPKMPAGLNDLVAGLCIGNVMDWPPCPIEKFCVTCGAAM